MKTAEVTKREQNLIHLCTEAKDASKQFAEAIQYAALQAEMSPSAVRRYITALASEKANVVANETEQLAMLFTALPTVQGQVAV